LGIQVNAQNSNSDTTLEDTRLSSELYSELQNALTEVVVKKRDLTLKSHSTYEDEYQGVSLEVLDSHFEDLIN